MKTIPYRKIAGVILGIALGILATFFLKMDLIAVVLGALFSVFLAGSDQGREGAVIGFLSGGSIGLYLAIRNLIIHNMEVTIDILPSLLASVVLSGAMGALYGFLTGKLKPLYDKGQGPFF